MNPENPQRSDSRAAEAGSSPQGRQEREAAFSRRQLLQWSVPAVLAFAAGKVLGDTPNHTDTPHQDSHTDWHSDNSHNDWHQDMHFDHNDTYHSDHNDSFHNDHNDSFHNDHVDHWDQAT